MNWDDENRFEVIGAVWLITPMLHAAEAGHFGEPVVLPIEHVQEQMMLTPPYRIDRDKIERFKLNEAVLAKPVLISQNNEGSVLALFDGNHRLRAMREIGWTDCRAWSVPFAMANLYQLTAEEVVEAASALWLARTQSASPPE